MRGTASRQRDDVLGPPFAAPVTGSIDCSPVSPSLIPRDRRFYALFDAQAEQMVLAARALRAAFADIPSLAEHQRAIKAMEHAGDELTHSVVRLLGRSFVTPFDREDIYALSAGLDDVLDYIDEVAETFLLYGVDAVPPAANELARLVELAVVELQEAIAKLEGKRDALEAHGIEVHRLENLADDASRFAIAELFSGAHDALTVIKLKDIYTLLEDALDRCAGVANVIEGIVIKDA